MSFILPLSSAPSKATLEGGDFQSHNAERIQEKPSTVHCARTPPALEEPEEVYSLIPTRADSDTLPDPGEISSSIPAPGCPQGGCPQPWSSQARHRITIPGSQSSSDLLCVPLHPWLACQCCPSPTLRDDRQLEPHKQHWGGSAGWRLPQNLVTVSAGTQLRSIPLLLVSSTASLLIFNY